MNRPAVPARYLSARQSGTIAEIRHPKFTATLYDLLTAYAAQRQQRVLATVHLAQSARCGRSPEARASLERLVGMAEDWSCLDEFLHAATSSIPRRSATVFASSFAAAPGTGARRRDGTEPESRRSRRCIFVSVSRKRRCDAAPDLSAE